MMKKSVIMSYDKRKNMALKMITNKIFSIEKIYFDYSILKNALFKDLVDI